MLYNNGVDVAEAVALAEQCEVSNDYAVCVFVM